MKLCTKRKIILLALIFCFVLSSVFAEAMAAEKIDHDCKETFCLVCLKTEMAKSLKLASVTLLFTGSLMFSALVPKIHTGLNDYFLSPVVLRVRSNS